MEQRFTQLLLNGGVEPSENSSDLEITDDNREWFGNIKRMNLQQKESLVFFEPSFADTGMQPLRYRSVSYSALSYRPVTAKHEFQPLLNAETTKRYLISLGLLALYTIISISAFSISAFLFANGIYSFLPATLLAFIAFTILAIVRFSIHLREHRHLGDSDLI
jgi:hypothetical protein